MDNNKFRETYPLRDRNDEYDVYSDRCHDVPNDIEWQEKYIKGVKQKKREKGEKIQPEDTDDTRLYQLTMIEKLLESECRKDISEYYKLTQQINQMLNDGMIDEFDSKINKQIRKKLEELMKGL